MSWRFNIDDTVIYEERKWWVIDRARRCYSIRAANGTGSIVHNVRDYKLKKWKLPKPPAKPVGYRLKKSDRGFKYAHFNDQTGRHCSIHESSLATDHCIWLGIIGTGHAMHLTRKQVKKLLPHLQKFVETGGL